MIRPAARSDNPLRSVRITILTRDREELLISVSSGCSPESMAVVQPHRQPVQRAAVVLALQRAVATDLGAAEQPGDLGAEVGEGGGEARQRAGGQLRRCQRGQADVQRSAPLVVHLINPHLQRRRRRRTQVTTEY